MGNGGFHTTVVFNNYVFIAERQAKLIQVGLRKIVEQAKQDAKKVLVKGHGYDTGTLRKSISSRNVSAYIFELYTNVEYAIYVEYGTSKMSAIPFMFPAANAAGARIEAMVGAVIAQGYG